MTSSTRTLGVTFASFQPLGLQRGLDAARRAAELDFDSFWTAETTGPEAFATLAAAGAVAPGVHLGTGVLALQLRTPMVAAMGAATLQALYPDRRILLGVGISSPVVTSAWHGVPYGDRPLARVREYLTLVRECLTGEVVTFEGDFWSVRKFRLGVRLGDLRPELVLGALNDNMLALGGELADGVLLNYLPASHVPTAVAAVRRGGNARIHAYVHVGVTERTPSAVESARKDLFSYAVAPGYAKAFRAAGFTTELDELEARHAERDRDGALAAISDRMVDAIDIVGDADHVRGAVQAYFDAGVDDAVLMPLPWGPDRYQVVDDTMTAVAGLA
jgi:probable F420-dependent oxidoreductase